MIATISPLVQEASQATFWRAWVGHLIGAAIGGAVLGGLAGLLGWVFAFGSAGTELGAALMLLYALRELQVIRLPLIDRLAAVPFEWRLRFGREKAAWLYGLSLGFGFTARTPFASFHIMLFWLIVLHNPALTAIIGAAYGISRAMIPLVTYLIWSDGSQHAENLLFLAKNPRLVHIANGSTLAFLGTILVVDLMLK